METCEWTSLFHRTLPRIGDDFQVSELPSPAKQYEEIKQANQEASRSDAVPKRISDAVGHACVPIWSPWGGHSDEYDDFLSLVRAAVRWCSCASLRRRSPARALRPKARVATPGASFRVCFPSVWGTLPLPLPLCSSLEGKAAETSPGAHMSCCLPCTEVWIATAFWGSKALWTL